VTLLAAEVTQRKLRRELELWEENRDSYSRRGWIMLRREGVMVEVGFLARLPLGGQIVMAMPACVRIDFVNYDLWAPSVEFIDPLTREYSTPLVQALVEVDGGAQNLLVSGHPNTGRPFFCVPGIREYHDHPQHTGDPWLLHRAGGEGSLATICDRIWRAMARTLVGVHFQLQTVPGRMEFQWRLASAPGEIAPEMWKQAEQGGQNQAVALTAVAAQGQAAVSAEMLAALKVINPAGNMPPGDS
jgi:Predicted metal binding domain